jgi:hypothetical protein
MTEPIDKITNEPEERPPLFKSWTGWYLLVLGNLLFLIILFYLFTIGFK